ncbi:unnamed protein product [Ixodes pacificus]
MSPPPACGVCGVCVPTDGRCMKCMECHSSLHLGQCAGIAEATFTTMGAAKREKWRCKTCRSRDNRTGAGNVEATSQDEPNSFSAQLTSVNEKLDVLLSLKQSVDSLLTLPAKVDALLALKPTVELLRTTVQEVQDSVVFLSAQYDSVLTEITEQKKVTKDLGAEVQSLQNTVKEQANSIHLLQAELNDAEQQHRLPNMEIQGMPSTPKENLNMVLCDLASNIGLSQFTPSDVLSVHRLPPKKADKPTTAPLILVRFASVALKEQWMRCRGRLRELSNVGSQPKLFFNDNLTRSNRELFWMARNKGKESHYKYIWVKHAHIYARKSEGSPLLRINSVGDIAKIV